MTHGLAWRWKNYVGYAESGERSCISSGCQLVNRVKAVLITDPAHQIKSYADGTPPLVDRLWHRVRRTKRPGLWLYETQNTIHHWPASVPNVNHCPCCVRPRAHHGVNTTNQRTRPAVKPLFHVQLLHAIILGSGRGYRCQLVCVTSLQKCRLTNNYCYYQPFISGILL